MNDTNLVVMSAFEKRVPHDQRVHSIVAEDSTPLNFLTGATIQPYSGWNLAANATTLTPGSVTVGCHILNNLVTLELPARTQFSHQPTKRKYLMLNLVSNYFIVLFQNTWKK
jgi:hypothetical protein